MTSVGIDIVSINRIEQMIKKFGQKALKRFLDQDEITLAKNNTHTIAGFWAAKEAASKALGTGISKECSFFDIKISKTKKNAPKIKLKKKIRKKYKFKKSIISITHDGGFAIAIVCLVN
jgi:holo-[acyl-carrier protein] synthase